MHTKNTCRPRQLLAALSILMGMMLTPQALADEATLRTIAIENLDEIQFAPGDTLLVTEFYSAVKDTELDLAAAGQSQGLIALVDIYDADGVLVAASIKSAPFNGMLFVSEGSQLRLLELLSESETISIFCFQEISETDSDGDGIPDDQDACPHSILGDTVIIGDCDSGVENILFADGCTLADLIQACADDARNHGQFVRCVVHLSLRLRKAGILTRSEAMRLRRCAARARYSSGPASSRPPLRKHKR